MRSLRFVIVLLAAAVLSACSKPPASAQNGAAASDREKASYAIGLLLGEEVREGLEIDGVDADSVKIAEGFVHGLESRTPAYDREHLEDVLEAVHERMQALRVERLLAEDDAFRALHDANLERSRVFHAAHAQEDGVITLDSGVQYRVMESGDGPSPAPADTVVLDYRVTLLDGTEVDAGESAEIVVEDARAGGRQILLLMKVGDHWQVAIPPNLAYGAGGDPPMVGPNETILVDATLLGIKEAGQ